MPGRKFSSSAGAGEGGYRYGFNGQEKSTEIDAGGNSMTAEFWQYDARIARRWNVDPVTKVYESPYGVLGNCPLLYIDPLGNDWYHNNKTNSTEWFDNKKDARKAGYTIHRGVNFYENTNNDNVKVWHGSSKEETWTYTTEQEIIVTARVPKGWNYKRREKYRTLYEVRMRDGLPIQQEGDHPDYTNHLAEYRSNYRIRKAFRDGGRDAVLFLGGAVAIIYAAPVLINAAPHLGRAAVNEVGLLKYVPKAWGVHFGAFSMNMALEIGFKGANADAFDAAVSTYNPLAGYIVSPLVDVPLDPSKARTTFNGSKPLSDTGLDYLFSSPFIFMNQTLKYLPVDKSTVIKNDFWIGVVQPAITEPASRGLSEK